jgi:hypothetical protein
MHASGSVRRIFHDGLSGDKGACEFFGISIPEADRGLIERSSVRLIEKVRGDFFIVL